ncbi:MAG TPA: OmpA family protein [Vicinamibacterales bacterium]|nr:OmpA family protein [Vicinamibacterales bacterium]
MLKRVVMAVFVTFTGVASASAQTPVTGQEPTSMQQPATGMAQPSGMMSSDIVETRKATTTFAGDTGLWFVPTAEILPANRWSFSAYRVNFDFNEGFTDVSNWPVTLGYGLADRAEIFGAFTVVRRIDRDVRPIFTGNQGGGLVNEYPFVNKGFSEKLGDLWLGAKINFSAPWRQQSPAFALRGMIKIPTADDNDEAVGTGKVDMAIDAIVSKEINERVELSGFGGFIKRGDPDGVEISNGIRYGFGAGFPTRKNLRLTAEVHGEAYLDDNLRLSTRLVGEDGSIAPANTDLDSPFNASLGLTYLGNKWFAGVGLNWRVKLDGRSEFGNYEDETGDSLGLQVRVGFHPGVRIYVAPPPPMIAPAPAPMHELSVKAQCDPCTVEVGKMSTVTAFPQSSIGCEVTYAWSAPTGTFANGTAKQTPWTAPMQEGTVPVTVTVTCPQDGKTASDTVNIQVIRPVVKQYVFEDVYFDFDRYSLRPEATRELDEAIAAMQAAPELNLEIEGHTCNIGTAEYNLALGERRAHSVRDYLTGRGIDASRLRTVSYGEERPKHDNAREETRRLNRRAALVVRLQR